MQMYFLNICINVRSVKLTMEGTVLAKYVWTTFMCICTDNAIPHQIIRTSGNAIQMPLLNIYPLNALMRFIRLVQTHHIFHSCTHIAVLCELYIHGTNTFQG